MNKLLLNSNKSLEHMDPKRQINLLETSGLSDAIEANLANHSKDSEEAAKEIGSAKLLKDATRNAMLNS